MNNSVENRERRIRRALGKHDYRLEKVRESRRDYWEYGPYTIVDIRKNLVLERGIDIDQVESWLADQNS